MSSARVGQVMEYKGWQVREVIYPVHSTIAAKLQFCHRCPEEHPLTEIYYKDIPVCGKCHKQLTDKDIEKIRFLFLFKEKVG